MLGLISLPYEIFQNIVEYISFDDAVNLGRTCRKLAFFHSEEICKVIVQNKIRYSNEALAARMLGGSNAKALRRVAKRYNALATATPFVVAIIGLCDAFLYRKGILCYTLDNRVRILNLHQSGKSELVISIPGLLAQTIGEDDRGAFRILYYSDYILSCLYDSGPDSTAWLIAVHLKTGAILAAEELELTDKIFARHNEQYLYYGTHSEMGNDGYLKWVISGYEFGTRKWFDQKIHLSDMVGCEIGSTICFEFYNGFFYALSNVTQDSTEVEDVGFTSSYHFIRFPLNSPCKDQTENGSMWRRQHQEGPIDDRLTSLSLDVDESTEKLRIIEARTEWYQGSSIKKRTYYTTDIVFPDPSKDDDSSSTATFPSESSLSSDTSISASSSSSASIASTSVDSLDPDSPRSDPFLRLLERGNYSYFKALARRPENTHPGGDCLVKSRMRTYHTSCSTFLDLVDDPLSTGQDTQRLRLRAGSRRLGPPLLDSNGLLRSPSAKLSIALDEMYIVPEIAYWPPPQDPNLENRDEEVDKVYKLLNPPSHLGNVKGMADERSLVYVTGVMPGPQALIFVGFDPAIKLEGLKKWGGLYRKKAGEGKHVDGRAKGYRDETVLSGDENGMKEGESKGKGKEKNVYIDVGEADRAVSIDRQGKGEVWVWKEKAMYRDINRGFYFGLDKPLPS